MTEQRRPGRYPVEFKERAVRNRGPWRGLGGRNNAMPNNHPGEGSQNWRFHEFVIKDGLVYDELAVISDAGGIPLVVDLDKGLPLADYLDRYFPLFEESDLILVP